MLFVILVLLIVLLAAAPYMVIVCKRINMIKSLKKIAAESGYAMHKLHLFVCLATNRSPKFDLLFVKKEQAYAVKLWSATRKNGTLAVSRDGRVREYVKVPPEMGTAQASARTVYGSARRVPKTKNNFKLRREIPLTPIMLFYPAGQSIVLLTDNGTKKLSSGDRLFGKLLCSRGNFEKMLSDYPKNYIDNA